MRIRSATYGSIEDMMVMASEMVRPPVRLSTSQAAVEYRKLNNPGSYVGPWRNEKTPYLVEPMDTLDSLDFTEEVFAGPARTGKSDMCLNWITKTSICDPADMMIVHMTQASARDWSQRDLARLFRHSPEVGSRLLPGRQNDNVHDKKFKSGMDLIIKWPTITELSAKTMRYVWEMDYDRMPLDVDGEGPPFDLGAKRTTTFKRFGMTMAESSPGYDVEDPKWEPRTPHEAPPAKGILALYNRGDRRRWYWRCLNPNCRRAFEADFKHFNYPRSGDHMEAAEMVTLTCPHCQFDMEPEHKQELNAGGRWIKEGMLWLPDGKIVGTPIRSKMASFWLKGPAAAFQDWSSIVYNYLKAEEEFEKTGDEGALRKTTNTDQGLPYLPKAMESARSTSTLSDRKEEWGGSLENPVVPDGVRFLVATVDVQAGGRPSFVVQVHGIGENGEIWLVHYFKIRKSARLDADGERELLDPASYPEDWHILIEEVIERTYPLDDDSGRRMAIKITACDSGGRDGVTANAYAFWRYLRGKPEGHHKRFRLVKGEPSKTAPRIREGFPDSTNKQRSAGGRGDVPVLFINSTMVKDQVSGILGREVEGLERKPELVFGAVHFPSWTETFIFQQLTAEVRTGDRWENPRSRRNEAWDLLVYCIAICLHAPIRLERLDWSAPPLWAEHWDENELVFGNEDIIPTKAIPEKKRSLRDLASGLS